MKVQGCHNEQPHDEHTHEVRTRIGQRHGAEQTEQRRCPGKIICAVCKKAVYKTNVQRLGAVAGPGKTPVTGGGWKCAPRCRR